MKINVPIYELECPISVALKMKLHPTFLNCKGSSILLSRKVSNKLMHQEIVCMMKVQAPSFLVVLHTDLSTMQRLNVKKRTDTMF